jgi:hypothetical protein
MTEEISFEGSFVFSSRGHTFHVSICGFLLQADKHTQETTKLTEKNSTENHKWKRAKCDHVSKRQKNPRSRFLQAYGNINKNIHGHVDGHVVYDSDN